jgi:hypothetical protein
MRTSRSEGFIRVVEGRRRERIDFCDTAYTYLEHEVLAGNPIEFMLWINLHTPVPELSEVFSLVTECYTFKTLNCNLCG